MARVVEVGMEVMKVMWMVMMEDRLGEMSSIVTGGTDVSVKACTSFLIATRAFEGHG